MKRPRSPDPPSRRTSTKMNSSKSTSTIIVADRIPRYVQYTSPAVSTIPPKDVGPRAASALPLNLIAHIVSYIDEIGDLARVTRASRLLYYMTLPQLYRRVTLHSYGEMRYVNGRPEGFGSGSPFMMALNGLTTKSHATLVEDFRVWGKWQELGVEDFTRGRVPDSTMMFSILLRAATDRMTKLRSFSWELDCKPMKTLYQGLSAHNTLTSFTLRFPCTRVPRPSVLIPPMLNLRVFKALDIDPMCSPDDISILLFSSRKLEDVRLHFCPRMRAEAESIMNLNMFFGRCHKANYKLKVKHFAMQNWFGPNVMGLEQVFDPATCESITLLDTFGGNDPRTVFVDDTWKDVPPGMVSSFVRVRMNEISSSHIQFLKQPLVTLKEIYTPTNSKRPKSNYTPTDSEHSSHPITPCPDTPYNPVNDPDWIALGKEYIEVLGLVHSKTLRRLLLSDLWSFSRREYSDLALRCQNLEQIGLAVDHEAEAIGSMVSLLPKLKCLRILENERLRPPLASFPHEQRLWHIGCELGMLPQPLSVEYICLGELCYRVGGLLEQMRDDGTIELRQEMFPVDKCEVMKYEIWHLDALDISVDPIAPFST